MPDKLKDQRVPIMMTKDLKDEIDAWRRPEGIDDRSEAIRRLIKMGMEWARSQQQQSAA